MLKNQKGITLVALVITIIVLLILATAAITMALNSEGILNKSQKAVNTYNEAAKNEDAMLGNFLDQMNNYISD